MNNPLAMSEHKANAIQAWNDSNPVLAARGIDESTWNALCSTIYPGAKPDSVLMAIDYCNARNLDIMLKPVHLVPMSVKNAQTGSYEWRDVPMPGIGMYRIQAGRSNNMAGIDEPVYGPMVTQEFKGKNGKVTVTFPEWCKVVVHKIVGDHVVSYVGLEYWIENYATEGKDSDAPNAMWKKRPRAQLAKCAEAQALRKGWPEIDQGATADEMEGKYFGEIEINPQHTVKQQRHVSASERIKQAAANPIEAEPEQNPVAEVDPAFAQLMDEISMCSQSSDFVAVKKRILAAFEKESGEGQTLIAAFNSKKNEWTAAQNNPAAE